MTDSYKWSWDDRGSGARRDICVWTPVSRGSLRPLGHYADPNRYSEISGKRASLLIGQNPNTNPSKPAVAQPVDYNQVWTDRGSGGKYNGAFWRPVPPNGYVALGDVCKSSWDKPSTSDIWCVRKDLVANGSFSATSVWDDKGSGSKSDVSVWEIKPAPMGVQGSAYLPIQGDTFRAQGNYLPPDNEAAPVLQLPVGKDYHRFEADAPLMEANKLPEKGERFYYQPQCSITLPFHCFFNPNNHASLENNHNPFLTITKSIAWYAECVWVNRTDKTVCREEKIRYGVNKEKREEIKGNIGIEFSSTKGVVLSDSGLTLNHQFADSSSTFFPEYSVRESAESFEVPPSTASALFTQRIWIKCSPPDSDVMVGEAEFLQSTNYHYRGCAL
ncbi:unnamed protein product, partial [Clonostachys solani]